MPVAQALRLTIAVCEALRRIHEDGIVHRDLKPDNVMVFADDKVKLIDFGLAAPKGARRGDRRSDIYALGVMLYEMLARTSPWEGRNPSLR